MSNTAKTWTVVVIIIVLIIVAWLIWGGSKVSTAPVVTPTPDASGTPVASNNTQLTFLSTATDDSSDTALQTDFSSVDKELAKLDTDYAVMDQSINNPPTSPSAGL